MFHILKENTDINKTKKTQQVQKNEQDNVITSKLKPQMKLCSCPLESIYCLKKCPGAHSTLSKYATTGSLQQATISAAYAR
jgi:hypothetical protein